MKRIYPKGRDNVHFIYKEKWACFRCRKCFKQRSSMEVMGRKRLEQGEKRVVLCPQCRKPMTNMGWDFHVPKQMDVEQWKKVELLAENDFTFHSRCRGQSHTCPGFRPRRLRDVKPFLEKQKKLEADKANRVLD